MRCASGCVRGGDHRPGDQAELVLSSHVEEWIADNVDQAQWDELLDDIVVLVTMPWVKHPLSHQTATDQPAGLNTTATLHGDYRIDFRATITPHDTGLIEIIAIGPRTGNRIYDAVNALMASGALDADEMQSIGDMLTLYENTPKSMASNCGTTVRILHRPGWSSPPLPSARSPKRSPNCCRPTS